MNEKQPVTWAIVPAMTNPQMTEDLLSDLFAQSVPVRVLLVLQGVAGEFRSRMEQIAEQDPRLLVWTHDPPLPSLSATWNRALEFVWACGGEEALVVNNDVRLARWTIENLSLVRKGTDSLFVSAVGVTQEQYAKHLALVDVYWQEFVDDKTPWKGGPDFSCYLIAQACNRKYPFDEGIIPLFTEDLDLHRRMMLGGDGDKIFSINLPFHHIGGGSQTLKSMEPDARAKRERQIDGARAYYQRKWGGTGVNGERFTIPFDASTDQDGVTTPDLQRAIQGAQHVSTDPAPTER